MNRAPRSPLAPARFPDLPGIAGVRLASAAAGVRYRDRADLMAAEIAPGSTVAGVFTRSATRAAPVIDCETKLAALARFGPAEGGFLFLVNSGNANAFTGAAGVAAVRAICQTAGAAFGIDPGHVLTASTGVIGEPLPASRITDALGTLRAGLSESGAQQAAAAIMTTDTYAKGAAAEVAIDGQPVRIMGIAKGSGMIAPDMATMLAFVFTDAAIAAPALQTMLRTATRDSFNAITVDGDTSTSDTVLLAATGQAAAPRIDSARSRHGRAFAAALTGVMRDLAHQVVKDGEGATKFAEIAVTGASSAAAARKVAFAIANSPLVKTALAGEDPNWGRIVMAVGKSGARADRDRLTIRFGDVLVAEKGQVAETYREADAAAYMKRQELQIAVDLGLGRGAATVWTCDLTTRYVDINADYRS
jgi:glutamate N-acetyltransferase/amino-acid N-acetyltransferase